MYVKASQIDSKRGLPVHKKCSDENLPFMPDKYKEKLNNRQFATLTRFHNTHHVFYISTASRHFQGTR